MIKEGTIDASVIIVNWNTCDLLRDSLASIYAQGEDLQFEVIVVDNGSTDYSVPMVKTEFPQALLIGNSENRGFAAANNQGMSIARGRYALLLNSDTIVLDNAIAKTVSFADAHPDAAVVGCRVLNPDKTPQSTCFMFHSVLNLFLSSTYLYKLFPRSAFFGRQEMKWRDGNDMLEVDAVRGCFMLVRREAMEQIGGMDEGFFMYSEDIDWCYRFKQAGWKVVFAPVGEVIHLGGQSSKKARSDMLIQWRLSILKFMKKHHDWLTYRLGCIFTIVFFLVRLPIWVLVALVSGKKREEACNRVKAYTVGVGKVLVSLFTL